MTNQGGVQQAVRDITGTALDYNGDWSALFDLDGIPSGDWNGRLLAWINQTLGTSYTSVWAAMQAFAESQGFRNWSSMNTFTVSEAAAMLAGEADGLALAFTDDAFLNSSGHYGSARVKDTSTPANNYNSHPFGLLTYAGASKKWVRGPSGLLIESDPALTLPYEWDENGDLLGIRVEEQRVNLFLNNREPETQDITVTAQAYTLSLYGTGSITLSGAHSDTLEGTGENDRVTLTFTPEAGTLTCTVDGDIDFVQLEAGAFATSPIETAGSTVTRAEDNISLATNKFPLALGAAGSMYARGQAFSNKASQMIANIGQVTGASGGIFIYVNVNTWVLQVRDGGAAQCDMTGGSGVTIDRKMAAAWDINDFAFIAAGGFGLRTDSSGTVPATLQSNSVRFGMSGFCGYIKEFMYVPRRMSNTELQEITS